MKFNLDKYKNRTKYDLVKKTKADNFTYLNETIALHNQTVLFGDSITEIFNYYEYFYNFSKKNNQAVYNRGISGDTSDRLLERLEDNVLNISPKNLVILIGTNDIGLGAPNTMIAENIEEIIHQTKKVLPNINIILEAVYPVNRYINREAFYTVGTRKNKAIAELNNLLKNAANKNKVNYLDLTDVLSTKDGKLSKEFSYDGLHLNVKGFEIVAKELMSLLNVD